MNHKIARFLAEHSPETPCLVVDLDVVAEAYELLCRYLSIAGVYYAVKANPAPEIVAMLAGKGSNFDVASPAEIALCLGNGATAERLSFGNTIKKEKDIAFAFPAKGRIGHCRANSAVPRRWRYSCCAEPAIWVSTPMACHFMSAPSRPISANGTARSARRRACTR